MKTDPVRTKVKFVLIYNPAIVNQVADLMKKLDLGVHGISYHHCEEISYTTTTKVDKQYLKKMIGVLRKGLEEEGSTVYSIKHVK